MADAYDLLPYTEHAYAESHPDNLAVVARLSGFAPAASALTAAPRVLELGCGRGGNLLPMAASWPEASFVGVDRSETQIRDARRVAEAAGLANVALVTADFADAPAPDGPFDFVICHGVYSWVSVAARRTLLHRVRGALAPGGVAYLSFNTLPGWYRRLAARDFLRFAARSMPSGPRDALGWLHGVVSPEHEGYRAELAAVHARLLTTDAAYLTHEYLAEEHHPVYASTFLHEASDAGLTYLGDALPRKTALELAPEEVRFRAAELDQPTALDLLDFSHDTGFRRALVVRADTARSVAFRAPARLDATAFEGLRLASRLRPLGDAGETDVESFAGSESTVQASGDARKTLRALAEAAPRSIPFAELAASVGATPAPLARDLYDLWLATPGLDLHVREPALATTLSRFPRACAVARWHALEGGPVTNVWHQELVLPEAIVRFILGRLDGKTTAEDLIRAVGERVGERLTAGEAEAVVEASLRMLAKGGVLVA